MNWNGILITSVAPTSEIVGATSYRGLCYGRSWPLATDGEMSKAGLDVNQAVIELTTGRSLGNGTYPPAVVADLDVVSEYVQQCHATGIRVRVMLCATPRPWPLLTVTTAHELMKKSIFMGFDYAYSTCDFSAVFSDLNPPPTPELRSLTMALNQNGIFNSQSDLENYIELRWTFVNYAEPKMSVIEGINVVESPLESSGDFVPFEIHELDSDQFLR